VTDTVECPRCGKHNPTDAKFCLECGSPLAIDERRVREERKVVSVLFADLVGFTAQAEQLDPEEVRAILQPYHAAVRADLERYGGTVEKFIGDAVMALFGAPVAHEDDPERAVRAALAVRESIRADGRLHVRIGVTSGEALVAIDARPESGEGMASGDVVNTAARLQSAAPVDGILVDEPTYRATTRVIDYDEHPPLTVKGKAEPIAVHQALAARARFGVDVRQIADAPLVGRRREMELATGALERALNDRQPQLLTLVGVPGIGKSRIVWELFQQVDAGTRLVAWRQGRSLPYAESVSFWALGEIIKAEAGILETDESTAAGTKLRRAIDDVVDQATDAEWIERHLRPLVGLEPGVELRGDHRGEAFAAWRHYLESLADRRPLVLVFEDLHWADDGLLDFLDQLVDWATDVSLLIVGTSRPELLTRRPGWGGGKSNALTLSLAPLSETEASSLVASLVERALVPASMLESIVERAAGNPLYAEEFARLLADRGTPDDIPDSVQGIIAARLDALSRTEKGLLQDAAVVGKVFWSGALAAMGGLERLVVEQAVHGLERREFVRRERRSSVADETEYAFRHILVRDVAYNQIPRGERSKRHVRAATWIESLARPADHSELLAQHYLSAIEFARAAGRQIDEYADRARGALRDAGQRALALSAFAAATRYFRAALELTPADAPDQPLLLFGYGKARAVAEEAGADTLAEAEQALRMGRPELAAEAAVLQAELAWFAGDGNTNRAHLARAAELVDAIGPSYSKAYVLSDLSRYHMLRGEPNEAIDNGLRAIAIADELGLNEIKAHALNNVGSARNSLGDPQGVRDLEQAVEIADAMNSPEVCRAMNNLAVAIDSKGDPRARELWRRAIQRADELGNVPVKRFIEAILSHVDYAEGNWDRTVAWVDRFLVEAEASGGHAQEAVACVDRGRIRLARGELAAAEEDARRAEASARRAGDPQALAVGLSFGAICEWELGRPVQARGLMDEVLELPLVGDNVGADFVLLVHALVGQPAIDGLLGETSAGRWRDLFDLIGEDRFVEAALMADELLYLPIGAILRLAAARQLAERGEQTAARAELDRAIAFWQTVGAERYLAQARDVYAALDAGPPLPADGRQRR